MIFNLLTFLAALSTAGVAEWFSIVGIISIYAGAPYHAGLVLGVVLGFAKLVSTSWLYRNWDIATWKIKAPLIYFLLALMMATSMGVFGFLTKSHLEQGAATVNNSAKIERIEQQIAREKSTITDNEKVIAQLDASINSYIGKERTDKALAVRRSQAPQRKQLRNDIDAAQQRIDVYSDDKLKLTSEVRALSLEVGPIRYIAELFYGTDGDQTVKVESAVKMFTLLIVSTLDPLAIILLIAANHTLLRRQNEKKEKAAQTDKEYAAERTAPRTDVAPSVKVESNSPPDIEQEGESNERVVSEVIFDKARQDTEMDEKSITPSTEHGGIIDEEKEINIDATETTEEIAPAPVADSKDPVVQAAGFPIPPSTPLAATNKEAIPASLDLMTTDYLMPLQSAPSVIRSPSITRVGAHRLPQLPDTPIVKYDTAPVLEDAVLRELRGHGPHFIPQKINEETKHKKMEETTTIDLQSQRSNAAKAAFAATEALATQTLASTPPATIQTMEKSGSLPPTEDHETSRGVHNNDTGTAKADKYPVRLSWLKEFKGT